MSRPARKIVPPARYADNLELTSHSRAIASVSAASTAPELASSPLPGSSPPPQTDTEDTLSLAADSSQARSSSKRPSHAIQASLSVNSVIVVSPTTSDDAPPTAPKTKKPKTSLTSGNQEDSQVSIIDIDNVEDPQDERLNKSDPTADIKYFFTLVPRLPGQSKGRMKCNLCA